MGVTTLTPMEQPRSNAATGTVEFVEYVMHDVVRMVSLIPKVCWRTVVWISTEMVLRTPVSEDQIQDMKNMISMQNAGHAELQTMIDVVLCWRRRFPPFRALRIWMDAKTPLFARLGVQMGEHAALHNYCDGYQNLCVSGI
jgi:hypothetical protein